MVKACKNKNIYFNNCGFSKDQEGDDLILETRYQLYEIKPDLKKKKKKKKKKRILINGINENGVNENKDYLDIYEQDRNTIIWEKLWDSNQMKKEWYERKYNFIRKIYPRNRPIADRNYKQELCNHIFEIVKEIQKV